MKPFFYWMRALGTAIFVFHLGSAFCTADGYQYDGGCLTEEECELGEPLPLPPKTLVYGSVRQAGTRNHAPYAIVWVVSQTGEIARTMADIEGNYVVQLPIAMGETRLVQVTAYWHPYQRYDQTSALQNPTYHDTNMGTVTGGKSTMIDVVISQIRR